MLSSEQDFTPYSGKLDPRLDFTVGRRGIDFNGYGNHPGRDWIRGVKEDTNGPYLNKKTHYWAGEDANMGTGGWGQQRGGINYHIIRFADVLLMGAEAAAEAGEPAKALDWVNRVRQRAMDMEYLKESPAPGAPDAANYEISLYAGSDFANKDEAIKRIRFERRLELGSEGQRLFDLRRWGIATQVMTAYIANEARTIPPMGLEFGTYSSKYDVLPIPLGAIDLSGNILVQNDEWK